MPVIPAPSDKILPVLGGVQNRETGEFSPYYIIECHDTLDPVFDTTIWPNPAENGFFIHSISMMFSAEIDSISAPSSTHSYMHIVSPGGATYLPVAALSCTSILTAPPVTYVTSVAQTFDLDIVVPPEWGLHYSAYHPNPSAFGMTMVVADLRAPY